MAGKSGQARDARAEEILDAAQAVFSLRGFSGATTDEIARRARASKTTLYGLFGNKQALFRTLLARRLAAPDPADMRLRLDEPPREVLRRVALGVLRTVTSPGAAALVRVAVAEASRFPELKAIMADGLRYPDLEAYLLACRDAGLMRFADAERTAAMFVAMAQGDWTVRALYGLLDAPAAQDLEAHADLASRMFLAAVAPTD